MTTNTQAQRPIRVGIGGWSYDGWRGSASYEIDLPNGCNATILGNVIGHKRWGYRQ